MRKTVPRLLLAALALVTAACSVSTPRHGDDVAVGGALSGDAGTTGDLGSTSGDAAGALGSAPAPTAPGGGSAARTGRASGPGGSAAAGGTASGPSSDGGAETAASSAPGVTGDTITIGLSAPFSGVYGPVISALVDPAFNTWQADVNARGGIHGRKVVFKKVDNKFTPDGAISACKEAQANGTFMSMIIVGYNAEADCLDKAGIPALLELTSGRAPSTWRHARVITDATDLGGTLATFVKNALNDGDKKLGVMYIQTSRDMKDDFQQRAEELGMQVVAVEAVEQNQSSFAAELLRLREAGAQTVALLVGSEVIGILRDAKALNYQPRFTGGMWASEVFSQAGRNLMDGLQTIFSIATIDSPAYPKFVETANKHGYGPTSRDVFGQYGVALVLGRVLEAAGPNPTRESLLAGIDTIKGYANDIVAPVTWGEGIVVGAPGFWPQVCCHPDYAWKGLGPARAEF